MSTLEIHRLNTRVNELVQKFEALEASVSKVVDTKSRREALVAEAVAAAGSSDAIFGEDEETAAPAPVPAPMPPVMPMFPPQPTLESMTESVAAAIEAVADAVADAKDAIEAAAPVTAPDMVVIEPVGVTATATAAETSVGDLD